jgi:predicted transposase YbfD/YdcC
MDHVMDMFAVLEDPRAANTRHDMMEIMMISLCAVLCGATSCAEMSLFGRSREQDLKQFLTLAHGIPSHDTFSTVFRRLDPEQFEATFIAFMKRFNQALREEKIISIDGKALKRAYEKGRSCAPQMMVTAWGSELRLVLGCRAAKGGNEVKAALELLGLVDLKGAVVTADALHCRPDTAADIIDKEADYVLAIKGNNPTLLQAAESAFEETPRHPYAETAAMAHGRREKRRAMVVEDMTLAQRLGFKGLCALGRIASQRTVAGNREEAVRYYALSRPLEPAALLRIVRAHWDIENGQHWALDVVLDEDLCRNRKDHGARNLAVLRRLALNVLRTEPSNISLRGKTKQAAWGDCSFLFNLLSYMR